MKGLNGRREFGHPLVGAIGLAFLVINAQMPSDSLAQVLDRVVEGFLANNCLTLTGGGGGGTAQPLAGLCAAGPGATSTGLSAGGGASTISSLAQSSHPSYARIEASTAAGPLL